MPRRARRSLQQISDYIQVADRAQEVAPRNYERRYFYVRNESSIANMRIGFGYWNGSLLDGTLLAPGEYFVFETGFVPTDNVWIICGMLGARYTGFEG